MVNKVFSIAVKKLKGDDRLDITVEGSLDFA
jgi:hypothetical protein